MKILNFDPATSTGYSVAVIKDDNAEIYEYGFIDVNTTSKYIGDWCLDLEDKIKKLIIKHEPDEVTIEDYFFGKTTRNGSNMNPAYRTVIYMLCRRMDIPYYIINPIKWKKHISGKCKPSTGHKKLYGSEKSKKVFIQEALWINYKFRFPNWCKSLKTGKPIMFRYDIIDSVAMSVFWLESQHNIAKILLTVECPDDVVFNRKRGTTSFVYN